MYIYIYIGLDMERVFLLATGKDTAMMEFPQFCRMFTWEYPLTTAQEKALRRRAAASAQVLLFE